MKNRHNPNYNHNVCCDKLTSSFGTNIFITFCNLLAMYKKIVI